MIMRLTMYRLRAKIEISDESEKLGVIALFDGPAGEGARDSRHPDLGTRLIAPAPRSPR